MDLENVIFIFAYNFASQCNVGMQSDCLRWDFTIFLCTCIIKIFLSFEYPQIVRSEPKSVIINIEGRSIKIYIISENIPLRKFYKF